MQDQSVTQPSRKAESTTSTSGSTSENEACQDSEPEKEISLSQWPPSSPREHIREQLPPDSSVESSLQANRAEEEVGEGYSVQKRRKLSNSPASFVSAITDSENLTSTSGRLGKIVRSSPALPATPSRQDFRTSRSSEAEGQMITGERRSLVKVNSRKCKRRCNHLANIFSMIMIKLTNTAPRVVIILLLLLLQKNSYLHLRHVSGLMCKFFRQEF